MEEVEPPGDEPSKETPLTKPIKPEPSMYEQQSVGRLYFNLTKMNTKTRWKKLSPESAQQQHVQVWWELHEKYESELEAIESSNEDTEASETKKK